ncbi:SDR family NAD(P)-dependent oxidoreductase [Ferroacidibacillus organovorans]|uniref:NAD(P)-dependent oxidoreductase n=1 Tax=Ferroacidibacillus organovorans TaxID=1765683 RepID=A0A1V4ERR4_9BACL|nr:SDR family NAD(P)-dependent oxidoreductase [Ferroacidibacillus organovorans]OPG15540.1 NAD(P)-dependent oxidoreductase [Ferroacidibacillus organovorans]
MNKRTALITGASSGIGAATARQLAELGFGLMLGARREARLEEIAADVQSRGARVFSRALDVTVGASVTSFVKEAQNAFGRIDVLVNNAGLARGVTRIADQTSDDEWQEMLDTNVLGLLRVTRLVVPIMIEQGFGHVVNLGSTAGHDAYAGGSVYCATKFGVRAITSALRQELLGHPIRVTSVDPGMVETDFSVVRYSGDKDKADAVYSGVTPLTAEDVADVIAFAVTRKAHVDLDTIVMRPVQQGPYGQLARA